METEFKINRLVRRIVTIASLVFSLFSFYIVVDVYKYIGYKPLAFFADPILFVVCTLALIYLSIVANKTLYIFKDNELIIKHFVTKNKYYHISEIDRIEENQGTYPTYIKIFIKGKKHPTRCTLDRQGEFIKMIHNRIREVTSTLDSN